MKTTETIRRMSEANPVPDAGQLHSDRADAMRLFSSIERRRDQMIGSDVKSAKAQPPRPPSWHRSPMAVFVVAVVAVLVLAVPLFIFSTDGSEFTEVPVSTEPTTATTAPAVPPPTVGTTVPAMPVPTTTPVEAPVPDPPLELAGWQVVTPSMDLEAASGSVFSRVVATRSGFVAIGGTVGDGVWVSPDGFEWSQVGDPWDPVGLGVGVDFVDLAVNGDRIAAVIHNGWDAVTGVATSIDAKNWTFTVLSEYSQDVSDPEIPMGIAPYGREGFVVSGTALWVSVDGRDFELIGEAVLTPLDPGLDRPQFESIASDGRVVVTSTGSAELVVTRDGETWKLLPQLEAVDRDGEMCSMAPRVEGLAHGPAGFVAIGGCGSYGLVWTSPDGFVWSQVPYDDAAFGEPAWIASIVADERGYVMAGRSGPEGIAQAATVWSSTDGTHWYRHVPGSTDVESGVLGVSILDSTLLAVGWQGNSATVWRATVNG